MARTREGSGTGTIENMKEQQPKNTWHGNKDLLIRQAPSTTNGRASDMDLLNIQSQAEGKEPKLDIA